MTDTDGHTPAPTAPLPERPFCPDAGTSVASPPDAERRRPGRAAYTNPALLALLRQDGRADRQDDTVETPGKPVDALAPARGIALAAAIGVALWAAMLLALWLIWPG